MSGLERTACTEAGCEYVLTRPIEKRCPMCSFKGPQEPQFPLPSEEEVMRVVGSDPGAAAGGGGADGTKTSSAPSTSAAQAPSDAAKPAASAKGGDAKGGEGKGSKKKAKKKGGGGGGGNPQVPENPFDKILIKTGLLSKVTIHPDSEKLLVCEVDVGEDAPRSICAGMQADYKPEELQGRLVCVVCNMRKANFGGVPSEGMILAGTSADGVVRVLEPPVESGPGARVFETGRAASDNTPKAAKSKFVNGMKENLKVIGGFATHREMVLRTEKGEVRVPDLADGTPIS